MIAAVCTVVVPAGYAAVTAGLGVIFSVVSNLTEVIRIQPCPAYFYCPGGSPLTSVGLPHPCPDFLRSAAGAKQLADCNGEQQEVVVYISPVEHADVSPTRGGHD